METAWTQRYRKKLPNCQPITQSRSSLELLVPRLLTVKQLIDHFLVHELNEKNTRRAHSTKETYRVYFNTWIEPYWGAQGIHDVRTVAVEHWLEGIQRADGTKAKIRNIMSALFNHGIRHEWLDKNPITLVRQSAKRRSRPHILESDEIRILLQKLDEPYHSMVLLAAGTGLRVGELLALKWRDIDCDLLQINLERGIFHQVVGRVKTEASQQPVPLDKAMVSRLLKWRRESSFTAPDDWIFASPTMNGRQPYWPDSLLKRHIRPTASKCGIRKQIGWHTFRHSFATLLKDNGEDVKLVQEALRHASYRTTMNIYTQVVPAKRRRAQTKVFRQISPGR